MGRKVCMVLNTPEIIRWEAGTEQWGIPVCSVSCDSDRNCPAAGIHSVSGASQSIPSFSKIFECEGVWFHTGLMQTPWKFQKTQFPLKYSIQEIGRKTFVSTEAPPVPFVPVLPPGLFPGAVGCPS